MAKKLSWEGREKKAPRPDHVKSSVMATHLNEAAGNRVRTRIVALYAGSACQMARAVSSSRAPRIHFWLKG
jgi:hypothetical protein